MAEGEGPPGDGRIHVTVMYSPRPRTVEEWVVVVPSGASVLYALEASGLRAAFPDVDLHSAPVGVWGRKARPDQILREGDRVEIYRALEVDPKVARRERFRRQGARAAGLFARRGKGAGPAD